MKPIEYPSALRSLIAALKHLPGVGPRTAERMALHLIQASGRDHAAHLAKALSHALDEVRLCGQCGFFTISSPCEICSDQDRDRSIICVIEHATDILPIERTGSYRGLYHALGGRLSPLDGVHPEHLRIRELLDRMNAEQRNEVILALSADVEGEATAHYLAEQLRPTGVRLTRIAQGLPAGLGLESADQLTLHRAMQGRIQVQ